MQYGDVTTNSTWRMAAVMKIVFLLYLDDLLSD